MKAVEWPRLLEESLAMSPDDNKTVTRLSHCRRSQRKDMSDGLNIGQVRRNIA